MLTSSDTFKHCFNLCLTLPGTSEDQIFELVICAAIGQATRQYETALEALAEAMTGEKGSEYASQDPQ
jgi:hypothetical protein